MGRGGNEEGGNSTGVLRGIADGAARALSRVAKVNPEDARDIVRRAGLVGLGSLLVMPVFAVPVTFGYVTYKCVQSWKKSGRYENRNRPGREKTAGGVVAAAFVAGTAAAVPAAIVGGPVLLAGAAGASLALVANRAKNAWKNGVEREAAGRTAVTPASSAVPGAAGPVASDQGQEPLIDLNDANHRAAWNLIRELNPSIDDAARLAEYGSLPVPPRTAALMAAVVNKDKEFFIGEAPEDLYQTDPASNPAEPAAPVEPSPDGQCQAPTAKGTRCRRKAVKGSPYCSQHASSSAYVVGGSGSPEPGPATESETVPVASSEVELNLAGMLATRDGVVSAAELQRRMGCSSKTAKALINDLEAIGAISPPDKSGARSVLVSPESWDTHMRAEEIAAQVSARQAQTAPPRQESASSAPGPADVHNDIAAPLEEWSPPQREPVTKSHKKNEEMFRAKPPATEEQLMELTEAAMSGDEQSLAKVIDAAYVPPPARAALAVACAGRKLSDPETCLELTGNISSNLAAVGLADRAADVDSLDPEKVGRASTRVVRNMVDSGSRALDYWRLDKTNPNLIADTVSNSVSQVVRGTVADRVSAEDLRTVLGQGDYDKLAKRAAGVGIPAEALAKAGLVGLFQKSGKLADAAAKKDGRKQVATLIVESLSDELGKIEKEVRG